MKAALDEELGRGVVSGHTSTEYRGELDMHNPDATVARGTPVDEIQWWLPDPDAQPYMTKEHGVTGGLTSTLGAAIRFSNPPIPMVFYLKERGLNGTPTPINYSYDWFDSHPGGLDWVYGESVSGEVRTLSEGLMGLTTETETGPEVWEWGRDDLQRTAMTYEDESELLVFSDHIDISPCCDGVAIILQGTRNPQTAIAGFDGYHAGFGSDGQDVSRWSDERILETIHAKVREESAQPIDTLWTINLTSTLMESMREIPPEIFDYAYDGSRMIEEYDEVPQWLLGRE